MKASEARRLNDEYAATQQLSVNEIYKLIRSAAGRGRAQVSVSLNKIDYSYRERVFKSVKAELESNGFTVKRSTWSDPRDNDSGDDLVVSW